MAFSSTLYPKPVDDSFTLKRKVMVTCAHINVHCKSRLACPPDVTRLFSIFPHHCLCKLGLMGIGIVANIWRATDASFQLCMRFWLEVDLMNQLLPLVRGDTPFLMSK